MTWKRAPIIWRRGRYVSNRFNASSYQGRTLQQRNQRAQLARAIASRAFGQWKRAKARMRSAYWKKFKRRGY